uniref:Acyl-CoA thioesterase II domain-containing protein n=1 Tax=Chrysotila carterae TaxID=13221 RepID=A0A7S4C0Z1_CHRCT
MAAVNSMERRKFVGKSVDLGWGRVYGGQTMAQGLSACQQLAGSGRTVHQFHCHFLRGGDTQQDIEFDTEQLTNGRSFSAMHVRAIQNELPILVMTASLQTPEEGLTHQQAAIEKVWGRPSELRSVQEHMAPLLSKIPASVRSLYEKQLPIEMRPSTFISPFDASPSSPVGAIWMKATSPLPDETNIQQLLLTYLSDWGMQQPAVSPHNVAMWDPLLQVVSLSHSVHFHRPFWLDKQWLCHTMLSPTSANGRGFTIGEFWTEDGTLVASTSQEVLIRQRQKKG